MAHTIEVIEKGLSALHRCDRCGAQAWVEVLVGSKSVETPPIKHEWEFPENAAAYEATAATTEGNDTLLFCAYHARQHEVAIMALERGMVADHRPALIQQESGQRDAASAAN